MSDYTEKYSQIFDYMSSPELPGEAYDAVVFGRKDPLVAHAIGELASDGLVNMAVITGGIGKDSGNILEQGFRSEAHYLDHELEIYAQRHSITKPMILLEERASNGGENARFSLALLADLGRDISPITAVAHATSLRRLGATVEAEARKSDIEPVVFLKPSRYVFDPQNPADRNEAAAELLRLADWPELGWVVAQPDLPLNLVDFARDVTTKK